MDVKAQRTGTALIRVRFTPYWAVTEGSGCVAPAGGFTRLTVRRAGTLRIAISFSLSRIRATSPRCN
jgi:hypothetical protein